VTGSKEEDRALDSAPCLSLKRKVGSGEGQKSFGLLYLWRREKELGRALLVVLGGRDALEKTHVIGRGEHPTLEHKHVKEE